MILKNKGYYSTLVGFYSPIDHNHDDNCVKWDIICTNCNSCEYISPINYCPSCDWKGRTECFCSTKIDMSEFPDDLKDLFSKIRTDGINRHKKNSLFNAERTE